MRQLRFGEEQIPFTWWSGQQLRGTAEVPLSFDLETEAIPPARPLAEGESLGSVSSDPLYQPRIAVGMAYDGNTLVLIHPSQLSRFVTLHRGQHVVGQNFVFDWWCLHTHCDRATHSLLWEWGSKGRLHDTMVLDMLLQLATGKYRHTAAARPGEDTRIYPAGLGALCEEWRVGTLNKDDPYRLRFGELLGLSEAEIDAHPEADGFLGYALPDAVATFRLYPKQRQRAVEVMTACGWSPNPKQKVYEMAPDCVKRWGPLGEAIQVRGSISLAKLSRTPLLIDLDRRRELEAAARERYEKSLSVLLSTAPDLVKTYKVKKLRGVVKKTKKSLLPQFDQKRLVAILEAEATRLNCEIPKSDGKLGGTSTSAKVWARFADRSEFIAAWKEVENTGKLLEFLMGLDAPAVYSRYSLLMRTGRTSAGAHKDRKGPLLPGLNVQQIPRPDKDDPLKNVRTLVTAAPGKLLYTVDIVYAELRTLAASCLARFGFSKLAEVVRNHTIGGGLDPHEQAALVVLGMTEAEYRAKTKEERKKIRQNIKPFSFGVPGGLGAKRLVEYASANYGVRLTPKEAKESRKKFLSAYPEIGSDYHLADRTEESLAYQLGLPVKAVPKLTFLQRLRWSLWMRGESELTEEEVDHFWSYLSSLVRRAKREDLYDEIRRRGAETDVDSEGQFFVGTRPSRRIQNLFLYRAGTLTGLIRADVNFSQRCNLPMQSLCSSAAKDVIWKLMESGYEVKLYLHDEFVVEVPERTAKKDAERIDKIINTALADVIGMGIPMAVEGGLARTWQKV